MEEVSDLTSAVNMISFVTNNEDPLGRTASKKARAAVLAISLLLAASEVDRVFLRLNLDFGSLSGLVAALRSSPAASFLTLSHFDGDILKSEPRLVPALEAALRCTKKTLKELLVQSNVMPTLASLNALLKLVKSSPDVQISLRLFSQYSSMSEKLAAGLTLIHGLRNLSVIGYKYSAGFCEALRTDWRSLRSLSATGMEMDAAGGRALCKAVGDMKCGLHTLHLNDNKLEDSDISVLVDGLLRGYSQSREKQGVLQDLDLCSNLFHESGGRKIAQLVKANPHLRKINLKFNDIGSAGAALGESLRGCATTLTNLNLHYCGLDAATVIAICHSLAGVYSLTALDISNNNIKDSVSAMRAVARDLLSDVKSLKELNLTACDIDGAGVRELAGGFAKNATMKMLDLSENSGVGAEIAILLDAMLQAGLKLEELSLRYCCINDAGGEAVGRFIARSSGLSSLDLSSNELRAAGVKAIFTGVAQSRSLKYFQLYGLGNEGARYVAEWMIGKTKSLSQLSMHNTGTGTEGEKAVAGAIISVAGKRTMMINRASVPEKKSVLNSADIIAWID